jgi:hypothetical protein
MALPLLLLLVVVGVSLVVGAVHLAGGSKISQLQDKNAALERFAFDFPDFTASKTLLALDHNVAVLTNDKSAIAGLVVVMGTHSLTRLLDADILNSVTRSNKGLALGLSDMTLPIVDIVLSSEEDILEIESCLKYVINAGRA